MLAAAQLCWLEDEASSREGWQGLIRQISHASLAIHEGMGGPVLQMVWRPWRDALQYYVIATRAAQLHAKSEDNQAYLSHAVGPRAHLAMIGPAAQTKQASER